MDNGFDVIAHEAELCLSLLDKVKADVVHLDTSLGGVPVEELSPVQLSNMNISINARKHLLKILPKLRKTAGEIRRKYDIEVLAIGKESIPVRIAELTTGSEAILYACAKAREEEQTLLLGLPLKCQHRIVDDRIYLHSLTRCQRLRRRHKQHPKQSQHNRNAESGSKRLSNTQNNTEDLG